MLLFGTLVIQAKRRVPDFVLDPLYNLPKVRGQHVEGRYPGAWTEINDAYTSNLFLPQRNKRCVISSTTEESSTALCQGLETLDSQYIDTNQLYKLNQLLADLNYLKPFAATTNVESTTTKEGKPISGSFYLFSHGVPLYLYLVFDLVESSTRLMWSTADLKREIRESEPLRYVFYQMPQIVNRPVFLPTQYLCVRWWTLMKNFADDVYALMKAANALELRLFKDPRVEPINHD